MGKVIRGIIEIGGCLYDAHTLIDSMLSEIVTKNKCNTIESSTCVFDFNKVVPIPMEYKTILSEASLNGRSKQFYIFDEWNFLEDCIDKVIDKYGFLTIAEWEFANWGCNGIADVKKIDDEFNETVDGFTDHYGQYVSNRDLEVYMIETEKSPCTPFIINASELYPSLSFKYKFSSDTMGYQSAEYHICNGGVTYINEPKPYSKASFDIAIDIWGWNKIISFIKDSDTNYDIARIYREYDFSHKR